MEESSLAAKRRKLNTSTETDKSLQGKKGLSSSFMINKKNIQVH
jgi:hypothetical protein